MKSLYQSPKNLPFVCLTISGCTLEALDLVLCCCGSLGAAQLAEEAELADGFIRGSAPVRERKVGEHNSSFTMVFVGDISIVN